MRPPPSLRLVALAALLTGCKLDTTGSTEIRLNPTNHAVIYGTVRDAAGQPVAGAKITPTIAQACPCYHANIYLVGEQPTTSATGTYRVHYEAALPLRTQTQGRLVIRLEVEPPTGSSLRLAYADTPYPPSVVQPLDSARVDVVMR